MAEAQAGPTIQTPAPADRTEAPLNSFDASLARLADIERQATIAANAQRDLEAEGIDPDEPADDDDNGDADEEDDDQDQDQEPEPEEEDEPGDEPQEPPEPAPTAKSPPPKRYSRRGAVRAAEQFEQQLQEATAELNAHRSRLSYYDTRDEQAARNLAQLTGVDGPPGHTTFERLAQKVIDGSASKDEAESVRNMRGWQQTVGPVWEVAKREVWNAFGLNFAELRKLDGVTDQVYQDLKTTPDPGTLLRKVFELGQASGERRTQHNGKRLEAQNSALRTKVASERRQPASVSNGTTPKSGRALDQMWRTNDKGEVVQNDEFWRRAERGELLGVDLSKT